MSRSYADDASDDDELSTSGVSHSTRGRRAGAELSRMSASDARKLRKNSRERARRHDLKELFDTLSSTLGLDERSKPEKYMILSLALSTITELSKRVQTLSEENTRLNEELTLLRSNEGASGAQHAGSTTQATHARNQLRLGASRGNAASASNAGSLLATAPTTVPVSAAASTAHTVSHGTHAADATSTVPGYSVVTTPTSNSMRAAADVPTPSAQMSLHHLTSAATMHGVVNVVPVQSAPPTPAELPHTPANSLGMTAAAVGVVAGHHGLPTAHVPGPPLSTTSAGTPNALAAMANLQAQQQGGSMLHMRSASGDVSMASGLLNVGRSTLNPATGVDGANPTSPTIPEVVATGAATSPTNVGVVATIGSTSGSASPAVGLNALLCSLTLEQQQAQGLRRGYLGSQGQTSGGSMLMSAALRRDSNPSISPSAFGVPTPGGASAASLGVATTPMGVGYHMSSSATSQAVQGSQNPLTTPTRLMSTLSRLHSGANGNAGVNATAPMSPSPSPSPSNGLAAMVLQTVQNASSGNGTAGAPYSPNGYNSLSSSTTGHHVRNTSQVLLAGTTHLPGPNLHQNLGAPPSTTSTKSQGTSASSLAAAAAAAAIRQVRDTSASISGSVSSSTAPASSFGSLGVDARLRGQSTSSSGIMGVHHPPHHPQHIAIGSGTSSNFIGLGRAGLGSGTAGHVHSATVSSSSDEERQRAASTASSTLGFQSGVTKFGTLGANTHHYPSQNQNQSVSTSQLNAPRPIGGSGSYKLPYAASQSRHSLAPSQHHVSTIDNPADM